MLFPVSTFPDYLADLNVWVQQKLFSQNSKKVDYHHHSVSTLILTCLFINCLGTIADSYLSYEGYNEHTLQNLCSCKVKTLKVLYM